LIAPIGLDLLETHTNERNEISTAISLAA